MYRLLGSINQLRIRIFVLQSYKEYCDTVMAEDVPAQKFIKPWSHKGKGIAVFTSGGDSQGISE